MAERIIQTTRKSKNSPIAPTPIETFVLDLPVDIGALDLDILKLTAQFVAKNGHSFQVGLLNREHKNPQFDFLKQNHPLHPFFLSLVESFTKCLLPPKNIIEKLKNDYKDKQSVLDRIIIRYDMEQEVERAKQAAEAENDKGTIIIF
jgi:splicing factor 3A subunit 1